jgi:hypothetical protein
MQALSPAERARRANVEPLPGHDGIFLAKLIALCRELQRDMGDQAFKCPVRFVQHFLELNDVAHASNLLRSLERRSVLKCVRRGSATKDNVPGQPSLYRFREPQPINHQAASSSSRC